MNTVTGKTETGSSPSMLIYDYQAGTLVRVGLVFHNNIPGQGIVARTAGRLVYAGFDEFGTPIGDPVFVAGATGTRQQEVTGPTGTRQQEVRREDRRAGDAGAFSRLRADAHRKDRQLARCLDAITWNTCQCFGPLTASPSSSCSLSMCMSNPAKSPSSSSRV